MTNPADYDIIGPNIFVLMSELSNSHGGGDTSGSIIRSIMIEQEEHDRVAQDPLMVVTSAVNGLKEREREVLLSRYGLVDGEKATLDAVGKKFGVTRERVRQVESAAIKKIASKPGKELAHLIKVVNHHLVESGGVVSLEELVKYFKLPEDPRLEAEMNALRLIMAINPEVVMLGRTDLLRVGWATKDFPQTMISSVAIVAEKILAKGGSPLTADELWEEFLHSDIYSNFGDKMNMSVFLGVIRLSEKITETNDGMWGLVSWPTVVPKRIRDKVYLIMEKLGKPMHFRDIATTINKQFTGKPVLSRTVHNELIGDDRFVLVGRGIYALKERGFAPGVVSDVIKKVLKDANRPLTTDEIVEKVLLSRQVKRNTVIANLQNKDVFKKAGKGAYVLAESDS